VKGGLGHDENAIGTDAVFYDFDLDEHVPANHMLREIDRFWMSTDCERSYSDISFLRLRPLIGQSQYLMMHCLFAIDDRKWHNLSVVSAGSTREKTPQPRRLLQRQVTGRKGPELSDEQLYPTNASKPSRMSAGTAAIVGRLRRNAHTGGTLR
jgi:hypothetical protein